MERWRGLVAGMVLAAGAGCRSPAPATAPAMAPVAVVPGGTYLVLLCRDEVGKPVNPSSAEVLFKAWGGVERFLLEVHGDRVLVPLDISWLRERITVDPERIWPTGYLYMKADGFAPIRSEGFPWIGTKNKQTGGTPADSVEVAFDGGPAVRLAEGEAGVLEVSFRKPRPRYLKLVERDGSPSAGVEMSIWMFWSNENHCGVLSGIETLGAAASDAAGRLAVPDLDGEHAFEIDDRSPFVFESPGALSWDPKVLVTRLRDGETVLIAHERKPRPLEMRVTRAGAPAAGEVLWGQVRNAGCGATWGPEATTGADGRIRTDRFDAEGLGEVWFEASDGERLWAADPLDIIANQPVFVELPAQ